MRKASYLERDDSSMMSKKYALQMENGTDLGGKHTGEHNQPLLELGQAS